MTHSGSLRGRLPGYLFGTRRAVGTNGCPFLLLGGRGGGRSWGRRFPLPPPTTARRQKRTAKTPPPSWRRLGRWKIDDDAQQRGLPFPLSPPAYSSVALWFSHFFVRLRRTPSSHCRRPKTTLKMRGDIPKFWDYRLLAGAR